jgi:hypothetical protein
VALDYYASKHVLYPLGGSFADQHNPDSYSGLINHLSGARDFINANGGIGGEDIRMGDENIEVLAASAGGSGSDDQKTEDGDDGGGGCFVSTLAER